MNKKGTDHLIKFDLKNVALSRFVADSAYPYIISPFSRIYLITEGKGWLLFNNEKIILEPGYPYLTPSFTPCSYFFEQYLEHYYIHFSARLLNGLNIYNHYQTENKVKCLDLDKPLFDRLLHLNPGLKLPHLNPDIYQTKKWLNKPSTYKSLSQCIETRAIIEQLLSRFICERQRGAMNEMVRYNLNPILNFIQNNIKEQIHIAALAQMACLSADHFTRIFKKVVGIPPGEFMLSKRIEKAKLLLLTTDLPQKRIFEESGFRSLAYFSRAFKKYTSLSPSAYRKMRG